MKDEVIPFHDEWEKVGNVPRELWTKAGEMGMLCVNMPEKVCTFIHTNYLSVYKCKCLSMSILTLIYTQYGGSELDILYSAVGWEEQSYANTTGPGWFLHSEIVGMFRCMYT